MIIVNKIMKSKFCINSTTSFQGINKAQTNKSTTKQTHSFSKSSRFQQPKPICPLLTYGGDFINKSSSGTGIGYGKRSDFTRCLTISPSSSKYNIKSQWEKNSSDQKGPLFALGRNEVISNSYIDQSLTKIPSATRYVNQKIPRQKSPNYSFRQKTAVIDKKMTIQPQNSNPGPGTYINPQNDPMQKSKRISKFQNLTYSQSKSKRFDNCQTISPGPGKYKDINNLPNNGTYVLSKNIGGTKAKFDHQARQTFVDKVYQKELNKIGPGFYKIPSEFGQYDGEIYQEMRSSKKRAISGWIRKSARKSIK